MPRCGVRDDDRYSGHVCARPFHAYDVIHLRVLLLRAQGIKNLAISICKNYIQLCCICASLLRPVGTAIEKKGYTFGWPEASSADSKRRTRWAHVRSENGSNTGRGL